MSNKTVTGRKYANSGPRRTWSSMEEQCLVDALKDLVQRGYKSDNGFRTGYLYLLEQAMASRCTGTDIKAEPHISSKIHSWKKSYNMLNAMLSKSGFGLGENFNIDVADDVWDAYVKVEPNARLMRFKTWPFYNDWGEIFGKDRATGEGAQGFTEAVQDFLEKGYVDEANPVGPEHIHADYSVDHLSKGVAESSNTNIRGGKSKRRRTSVDTLDPLVNDITEAVSKHDSNMSMITTKVCDFVDRKSMDDQMSAKRQKVYSMLEGINFPCLEARVFVTRHLCKDASDLDCFISLPEEARRVLVKEILTRD